MKRGRNQRRRPGGGNPNRALDSNGPDVRIRGTANQVYDKYVALARDASSSGDRVKAENYLQHAEHYFRLLRANQAAQQAQQNQQQNANSEQPSIEADGDSDESRSNGAPRSNGRSRGRGRRNDTVDNEAPNASADSADDAVDSGDDTPTERKPRKRRTAKQTKNADAEAGDVNDETAAAAE